MKRQEVILYEIPKVEYEALKKELEGSGFRVKYQKESGIHTREDYFEISINGQVVTTFEYRYNVGNPLFRGLVEPESSLEVILSNIKLSSQTKSPPF